MTITLSKTQDTAVSQVMDWFENDDEQTFFLSGFAGTGKSTIIVEILKQVIQVLPKALDENRKQRGVHVACPTGKAVNVVQDMLKDKGLSDIAVSTIHGFAFYPATHKRRQTMSVSEYERYSKRKDVSVIDNSNNRVTFEEEVVRFSKKEPEKVEVVKLLIIDEASMLTQRMHKDVTEFNIKILFVGDTAQLPPIDKYYNQVDILGAPDVQLVEIFRQGPDSAILELAERVRNGEPLIPGNYGANNEVKIITREEFMNNVELRRQIYLHADQIICGRNDTRQDLNNEVRMARRFSGPYPMVGEKVICLKNNRSVTIGGINLVNGLIGEVVDIDTSTMTRVHGSKYNESVFEMRFRPEGVEQKYHQDMNVSTLPFIQEKVVGSHMHNSPHNFFDFGYAITCHKSQGSQWDNVLVINEMLDKKTHINWLNTAITRARRNLIIVI